MAAILLVAFLLPLSSFSQSWERFEIDLSGCSALFPSEPEWTFEYSEDSSFIWSGEVFENDIYFGVICIEFSEPFPDDYDEYDLILVAEDYFEFLKETFSITYSGGNTYITWIDSETGATGVSDYWVDSEGDHWGVRCWIDRYNLVVMYMYCSTDVSFISYSDFFFNSFQFPEE